jgi:hypothetical protein
MPTMLPTPATLATIISDGSKKESGTAGSGIAWKRGPRWLGKGLALGKGKKAFDAEL